MHAYAAHAHLIDEKIQSSSIRLTFYSFARYFMQQHTSVHVLRSRRATRTERGKAEACAPGSQRARTCHVRRHTRRRRPQNSRETHVKPHNRGVRAGRAPAALAEGHVLPSRFAATSIGVAREQSVRQSAQTSSPGLPAQASSPDLQRPMKPTPRPNETPSAHAARRLAAVDWWTTTRPPHL